MSRPVLLDLFCGGGGAGMGYHRAGFDVVGVDINPQPRYPFEFIQADALDYVAKHGHEFDAIHASPPCQAHTAMKTMHNAKAHPDLIPETRELLRASGKPYVIENVPGAALINPITLCGTMFDLGVDDAELRRHRLFESNVFMLAPMCRHGSRSECLGVYGGHVRNRKRVRTIGVYGKRVQDRGGPGASPKSHGGRKDFTNEQGRIAMGIDWMTLYELCQAIPPAYTEFVGRRLMQAVAPLLETAAD